MSDIQRWKFMPDQGCLAGDPDGEWVEFEVVGQLQAEKTRVLERNAFISRERDAYSNANFDLRAENERLKEICKLDSQVQKNHKALINDLESNNKRLIAKIQIIDQVANSSHECECERAGMLTIIELTEETASE